MRQLRHTIAFTLSILLCLLPTAPLYALPAASPAARSVPITAGMLDTGSGSLNLAALKGRVVYLDFWASWCGPCRQSFPWLMAMQRRYGSDGLVVVAVNLDQSHAAAVGFVNRYHPNFPIIYDSAGKLAERFNVAGMPSSFIIDRTGKTRFRHIGFRDADRGTLESALKSLL